jgi:hypothetical protein
VLINHHPPPATPSAAPAAVRRRPPPRSSRARIFTEWLDPAVLDERDPEGPRRAEFDVFDDAEMGRNGSRQVQVHTTTCSLPYYNYSVF